jgi:hypothetical protein
MHIIEWCGRSPSFENRVMMVTVGWLTQSAKLSHLGGVSSYPGSLLTIEARRQSGLYAISALKSRWIIPEVGR